jgi:hypothetical protein
MSLACTITNLESSTGWTKNVGPTINPVSPSGYDFVQIPDGIRLYCCGPAYSGWLAKNVSSLLYPFPTISFLYSFQIDDATLQCGQVIETDSKITDAAGNTYDLSAQWNLNEGWMFQIDNAAGSWTDTGIKIGTIPTPNMWVPVQIDYALDFVGLTSSVLAVTVNKVKTLVSPSLQKIPAKKQGWAPSQIVTQLQQVINGTPGGGAYSVKFGSVGYTMST